MQLNTTAQECNIEMLKKQNLFFHEWYLDVDFSNERLSKAATCDGILYQIPAGNNVSNPPPGVLPI